MSSCSTYEGIEDEISSWGFSVSLSDFERSRQSEENFQLRRNGLGAGRGRGIIDNKYMETIRMVSDINALKAHPFPMGHLATTSEVLEASPENEITPLLRKLGVCGHDGQISSRTTRQVPEHNEEIRLDSKIPVILNGELFGAPLSHSGSDAITSDSDEPYDPKKPLQEQFTTIKEFAQAERLETPDSVIHLSPEGKNNSTCPNSSKLSSSTVSIEISSHSTPANDDSSSATSVTTYSTGEQYSNDQWDEEPLLKKKDQVYTPRQLYQIKKMHTCRVYPVA
ncbi:uncharacterized protein LOC129731440 isoform X1 [Wyeomyia smithii]|uniref:uncharacterized protein LOC129731440 isoform X1 n=1 Tax=Wyeomyia smithii TaxID=174621 RepID=UPI002467F1A8|nr:uncharacterized protein LOC129731440 isoform X1 [Wyeomyia smithii]